jgi:hypothetical protein
VADALTVGIVAVSIVIYSPEFAAAPDEPPVAAIELRYRTTIQDQLFGGRCHAS